eukprot:jgi/Undpi1/6904/HiC_scaffold_21.g09379.m1
MELMPPRAGIVNDHNEGGVVSCVREEERPPTPPAIRKWRRSGASLPGQRVLHPGQIGGAADVDPKMSFGSGGVKASDHVADVWYQPGADTDMNRLKLGLAEIVYHSSKREPLGKSYQRGHQLPQKVRHHYNGCDSLLGIQPCTHSNTTVIEQGRRTRCGPGEQRRRGYKWDVDTERHTFGRPGSLARPLRLDSGSEPDSRLVSKRLDDFRETQDVVGRVKSLGHDSRDHLGKRGPDEWDARACVEGDYSWAEQQPDSDLGKSITPGFRNAVAERRAFGVPSIRSDIPPYARRSVADTQNYGDDSSARYLVNPSQFSSVGIEDDEFFTDRGKLELRKLFESTGYPFSQEVFDSIWATAVGHKRLDRGDQDMCSIVEFQRAVNDYLHMEDVKSSTGAV